MDFRPWNWEHSGKESKKAGAYHWLIVVKPKKEEKYHKPQFQGENEKKINPPDKIQSNSRVIS